MQSLCGSDESRKVAHQRVRRLKKLGTVEPEVFYFQPGFFPDLPHHGVFFCLTAVHIPGHKNIRELTVLLDEQDFPGLLIHTSGTGIAGISGNKAQCPLLPVLFQSMPYHIQSNASESFLHSKHCFCQPDTCCRLHRMFHKGSDCLPAVPAFGRIDDIIRLNQDLIVNAVDLRRTMVVVMSWIFPSEKAIIFSMICAMVIICFHSRF